MKKGTLKPGDLVKFQTKAGSWVLHWDKGDKDGMLGTNNALDRKRVSIVNSDADDVYIVVAVLPNGRGRDWTYKVMVTNGTATGWVWSHHIAVPWPRHKNNA